MTVSKRYGVVKIGFVLALITLSQQNCSQFEAQRDYASQQQMMRTRILKGYTTLSQAETGLLESSFPTPPPQSVVDQCMSEGSCEYQGEIVEIAQPSRISQEVEYYCSNNWTKAMLDMNVLKATSDLKLGFIKLSDRSVACEITSSAIKQSILDEKKIVVDLPAGSCPNLISGDYEMVLTTAGKAIATSGPIIERSLLIAHGRYSAGKPFQVKVVVDSSGYISLSALDGQIPELLFKNNVKRDNEECDEVRSPLVVQITTHPKRIQLTAPTAGVLFNIAGYNDDPVYNALHRISWFQSLDTASHYFITLPNTAGNVTGIDEMFGDSTRGPDGAFASNGYEALRKWDGRLPNGTYDARYRDGIIDKHDAVYYNLRLWADANANGKAESFEMRYLEQMGLASISLNYDPNYAETDKYGNHIKFKSFAYSFDETPFLVYDIWYRLID